MPKCLYEFLIGRAGAEAVHADEAAFRSNIALPAHRTSRFDGDLDGPRAEGRARDRPAPARRTIPSTASKRRVQPSPCAARSSRALSAISTSEPVARNVTWARPSALAQAITALRAPRFALAVFGAHRRQVLPRQRQDRRPRLLAQSDLPALGGFHRVGGAHAPADWDRAQSEARCSIG